MEKLDVKTTMQLPEGYTLLEHIDLQKDKKLMITVNALALGVMLLLVVMGHLFVPISRLYTTEDGVGMMWLRMAVLIAGYHIYTVAHELTHGIFMKYYSGAPVKYGFTWSYAYAGSEAYFDKHSYIAIALAPIVILGIMLIVFNAVVPENWFWIVYLIQIANLSGAAGDLYVTARFSKQPEDILVQDSGVAMSVYSRCTNKDE